jgi:hypothetical protein
VNMLLRCAAMTLAIAAAAPAVATQYLLDAATSPETVADKLQPGDEIVLMPGEHLAFKLKNVAGTREKPIIIRGLDPQQPGPIRAQKSFFGIHLVDCSWIEVKDVVVFGAQYVGILVESAHTDATQDAHIKIRHASVVQTGKLSGDRDAIRVHGVADVAIEDCRIEGWTDSAIDVVASRQVVVDRCVLRHRDGFLTQAGVTIRAGSSDVRVANTRFDSAGLVSVAVGGISPDIDFHPRAKSDAPSGSLIEASDVTVSQCMFNLCRIPVSFIHASNVRFVKNTIHSPRRHIILAARETKDPRFAKSSKITFGGNLIEWVPSDLTTFANVDATLDPDSFNLETNLWWSPELPNALKALGPIPGSGTHPQIFDVDPKLDSEFRPTDESAKMFGVFSP